MTALYVDASAAVKLFVEEVGSPDAAEAVSTADALLGSRILGTEVGAALARRLPEAEGEVRLAEWERLWASFDVIELDRAIADHALALAQFHGLGTLGAIHLASALRVPALPLRFATWDHALAGAARATGLRVIPA